MAVNGGAGTDRFSRSLTVMVVMEGEEKLFCLCCRAHGADRLEITMEIEEGEQKVLYGINAEMRRSCERYSSLMKCDPALLHAV